MILVSDRMIAPFKPSNSLIPSFSGNEKPKRSSLLPLSFFITPQAPSFDIKVYPDGISYEKLPLESKAEIFTM